jgi:hypothetical protein
MRNVIRAACALLAVVVCISVAVAANPPSKADSNSLVIVFKNGHQQTFNMADVARIEVKTPNGTTTLNTPNTTVATAKPVRLSRFVGRWTLGDGAGGTFYITLSSDGVAKKSIGSSHGTWTVVGDEARISWDDGWHDAIRKVGTKYKKYAYGPEKSFTDEPSNVAEAVSRDPI